MNLVFLFRKQGKFFKCLETQTTWCNKLICFYVFFFFFPPPNSIFEFPIVCYDSYFINRKWKICQYLPLLENLIHFSNAYTIAVFHRKTVDPFKNMLSFKFQTFCKFNVFNQELFLFTKINGCIFLVSWKSPWNLEIE